MSTPEKPGVCGQAYQCRDMMGNFISSFESCGRPAGHNDGINRYDPCGPAEPSATPEQEREIAAAANFIVHGGIGDEKVEVSFGEPSATGAGEAEKMVTATVTVADPNAGASREEVRAPEASVDSLGWGDDTDEATMRAVIRRLMADWDAALVFIRKVAARTCCYPNGAESPHTRDARAFLARNVSPPPPVPTGGRDPLASARAVSTGLASGPAIAERVDIAREKLGLPPLQPGGSARERATELMRGLLDDVSYNQGVDRLTAFIESVDAEREALTKALDTAVDQRHLAAMGNSQMYNTIKKLAVEGEALDQAKGKAERDLEAARGLLREGLRILGVVKELAECGAIEWGADGVDNMHDAIQELLARPEVAALTQEKKHE
jgi:hypothetical protein